MLRALRRGGRSVPGRRSRIARARSRTRSSTRRRTALKGRKFESIEAQNAWLAHWEERWAAPRIHGRKKRQVLEMYREEQPHLRPLPLEGFRYFKHGMRTVDDAGLVQVDGSYYAALPARPAQRGAGAHLSSARSRSWTPPARCCAGTRRRCARAASSSRRRIGIFNPSRESARLLAKAARIGPHTAAAGPRAVRPPRAPRSAGDLRADQPRRATTRAPTSRRCARACSTRRCFSYAAVRARSNGRPRRRRAAARRADPGRLRRSGPSPSTNRSGRPTPRLTPRRTPMPMSITELERSLRAPAPVRHERHPAGPRAAGGQPRNGLHRGLLLAGPG